MGIIDRIKAASQKAAEEIEKKTTEKLMEEQVEPTLREHKGEPLKKPDEK